MVWRGSCLGLPLLVALSALFGCGGEGGCGSSEAAPRQQAGSGGGVHPTGGLSRAESVKFADAKGRVPKQYRRPGQAADEDVSRTPKLLSAGATPAQPAAVRVLRRAVDGIQDRVELLCPLPVAPRDCLSGPNAGLVKARCCPEGSIERCSAGLSGLHVIGRRCGPPAR